MDTRLIFFSKPSISQKEISNINKVLKNKIFSDGFFQKKTEILIKKKIKSKFIALTQSCTDALEMASSLINLKLLSLFVVIKLAFQTLGAFCLIILQFRR